MQQLRVSILFLLSSLSLINPAIAEPIYLACNLVIEGNQSPINFTVDEGAGTVSITIVTSGSTRTVRGTFAPDKVVVDEGDVRWEINRINLGFSRVLVALGNSTDSGRCEIQSAPKRAF